MAFFDWLFGDNNPDPIEQTKVTTASLPNYIEDPLKRLLAEGERLTGQPYQPYNQPRLEGFTPDQLAAFEGARTSFGQNPLRAGEAYNMAINSGRTFDPNEVATHLNPYVMNVAGQTADELQRRSTIQGNSDAAAAVKAGAFGGSRHGIVDAERNRNTEQAIGNVYNQVLAQGYDSALKSIDSQKTRELQAGLGGTTAVNTASAVTGADIGTLLGTGGMIQAQGQENLNIAQSDYQSEQQYPYNQLRYLSELIRGAPQSGTTTQTGPYYPQPTTGVFQSTAGLGIAGLSLANQLKWNPFEQSKS